jgi:hypothetical protein
MEVYQLSDLKHPIKIIRKRSSTISRFFGRHDEITYLNGRGVKAMTFVILDESRYSFVFVPG